MHPYSSLSFSQSLYSAPSVSLSPPLSLTKRSIRDTEAWQRTGRTNMHRAMRAMQRQARHAPNVNRIQDGVNP